MKPVSHILIFVCLLLCNCSSYAPTTELLEDSSSGTALIDVVLTKKPSVSNRGRNLVLRGGQATSAVDVDYEKLLATLPGTSTTRHTAYAPPSDAVESNRQTQQRFLPPKEGDKGLYGFAATRDFAKANAAYLEGDVDTALVTLDRILANPNGQNAKLLWRTSVLRADLLATIARADLAEVETKRTEELEKRAIGSNLSTRALRARVRYFAGDYDYAALDAAQVLRAIGDWSFPTSYSVPPSDQTKLIVTTEAQVQAQTILGMILIQKGFHREALPLLEKANKTSNDIFHLKYKTAYGTFMPDSRETFLSRGFTYSALATVQLLINPDSAKAQENFVRAVENFDFVGYRPGKALKSYLNAFALHTSGRHSQALKEAAAGLVVAKTFGLIDYTWRLELLRGSSLYALGNIQQSEKALRRSQSVIDSIAGTISSDKALLQFGFGKEKIVNLLARIDIRRNNLPLLFRDLEKGRARAFVALMAGHTISVTSDNQDIARKIRSLELRIFAARRKNLAETESSNARQVELQLLKQRERLVTKLRSFNSLSADAYEVSVPSIVKVQRKLKTAQAIHYFFEASEHEPLYRLMITKNQLKLEKLTISPRKLKEVLFEFSEAVKERRASSQTKQLATLDKHLRTRDLKNYKQLYIVASGPVHFVPWGGLSIKPAVAVIPTGSWVVRKPNSHIKQSRNVVLIGDPDFGGALRQLPGARKEALIVAKLLNTEPLLGSVPTVATVREKMLDGAGVLHFATHALFDPQFPLKSAVILTNGQRAVPLTAEDLFQQPMAARLVVLSACETGMGYAVAGDDMLGLTRSFYFGGASAIISSLWEVDDAATTKFMEVFHRKALKGDYGAAWLAARNALKKSGHPPSDYAPFILGGGFRGSG